MLQLLFQGYYAVNLTRECCPICGKLLIFIWGFTFGSLQHSYSVLDVTLNNICRLTLIIEISTICIYHGAIVQHKDINQYDNNDSCTIRSDPNNISKTVQRGAGKCDCYKYPWLYWSA